MKETTPIKVYYNSACPVCDAGINGQQQRMAGCSVEWIDVHGDPGSVGALGTGVEEVRERLHMTDAQGHTWVGADALAQLWLSTPRQRWLGRIVQWPLVKPIARVAYNLFARALYRWNLRRGRWEPKEAKP